MQLIGKCDLLTCQSFAQMCNGNQAPNAGAISTWFVLRCRFSVYLCSNFNERILCCCCTHINCVHGQEEHLGPDKVIHWSTQFRKKVRCCSTKASSQMSYYFTHSYSQHCDSPMFKRKSSVIVQSSLISTLRTPGCFSHSQVQQLLHETAGAPNVWLIVWGSDPSGDEDIAAMIASLVTYTQQESEVLREFKWRDLRRNQC